MQLGFVAIFTLRADGPKLITEVKVPSHWRACQLAGGARRVMAVGVVGVGVPESTCHQVTLHWVSGVTQA